MERDQFLSRVKSALRGAALPDVVGPTAAPEIRFDDPVARFIAAATAADATVTRVGDGNAASAVIGELEASPTSYIAWDGLDEVVPGFYSYLGETGWRRLDASVGGDSRFADHARIGAARVGFTTADTAIAATGSVVLGHGPGRPRAASLLVDHHIVLLPIDRIVHSLDRALAQINWRDTANVVAITGPSRTGDIESILTLGVHGPRHLSIVLIGRV